MFRRQKMMMIHTSKGQRRRNEEIAINQEMKKTQTHFTNRNQPILISEELIATTRKINNFFRFLWFQKDIELNEVKKKTKVNTLIYQL